MRRPKDQRIDQQPHRIQDVGHHAKRMTGLLVVVVIGARSQRGAQKAQGERAAHRETSKLSDSNSHFRPLSRRSHAAATTGSDPIASGFAVHRPRIGVGEPCILRHGEGLTGPHSQSTDVITPNFKSNDHVLIKYLQLCPIPIHQIHFYRKYGQFLDNIWWRYGRICSNREISRISSLSADPIRTKFCIFSPKHALFPPGVPKDGNTNPNWRPKADPMPRT